MQGFLTLINKLAYINQRFALADVKVKKKYPLIKNRCKNSYYCGILQNLFAGNESECVLIMQIKYQLSILGEFYENYTEILKNICSTDLTHQELLANAILMCGGDPIYANAQNIWLGGRQVDYIKDLKQIISYDIEIKEKIILDYKIAIAKIDNFEIKSLLASILQDEESHLRQLKNIK